MGKDDLQITAKTVRMDSGMVAWKVYLSNGDVSITPMNGTKISKQGFMEQNAFCQMVSNATVRKEQPTPIWVSPTPSCFVDGYITSEAGSLGAIMRIPSRKFQFLLKSSDMKKAKAYSIPMPNLVYLLTFTEGVRKNFWCFTYRDWKGDKTELCMYPFGNVSDKGNICMGSIKTSNSVSNFYDFIPVIEESLLGVTNDDYLTDSKTRTLSNITQRELAEELKNAEEFPHQILLPCSSPVQNIGQLRSQLRLLASI